MSFYERLSRETEAERGALYEVPLMQDAMRGRISRETYIAYLTQAYHHVKHTLPLLMAAGGRVPPHKEEMRRRFADYIAEETGHEEWILNDIRAAGGDAEAARKSKPALATDIMTAYAWDVVNRRNPVSFLGMVFVLEGTSVARASQAAQVLMDSLKLPRSAFTYLTSHGALDMSHLKFFEETVNMLDAQDQEDIIEVAKVMFRLFADIFRSIPHTVQEAA